MEKRIGHDRRTDKPTGNSFPRPDVAATACGAGASPAMMAITTCMRKLLTVMNAMINHHSPWTTALDMQHSC